MIKLNIARSIAVMVIAHGNSFFDDATSLFPLLSWRGSLLLGYCVSPSRFKEVPTSQAPETPGLAVKGPHATAVGRAGLYHQAPSAWCQRVPARPRRSLKSSALSGLMLHQKPCPGGTGLPHGVQMC